MVKWPHLTKLQHDPDWILLVGLTVPGRETTDTWYADWGTLVFLMGGAWLSVILQGLSPDYWPGHYLCSFLQGDKDWSVCPVLWTKGGLLILGGEGECTNRSSTSWLCNRSAVLLNWWIRWGGFSYSLTRMVCWGGMRSSSLCVLTWCVHADILGQVFLIMWDATGGGGEGLWEGFLFFLGLE